MGSLIDGQAIAKKINAGAKRKVTQLRKQGIVPKLAVVLVGENKASKVYVSRKEKAARELGINFTLHKFPTDVTQQKLLEELRIIQADTELSGLIIQLPLPERLYTREILNAIKPGLDADYLTDFNLGKLVSKSNPLDPPTASAALNILKELKIGLIGKDVVVIGAGFLVGKPITLMLINSRATVTVCNSSTKNLEKKCQEADIIVSCVGKRNLVVGSMVKKGAVVIDCGFVFENGVVSGDVNVSEVMKTASLVTPTPGGVGPITVAKLLQNVVLLAERKLKIKD